MKSTLPPHAPETLPDLSFDGTGEPPPKYCFCAVSPAALHSNRVMGLYAYSSPVPYRREVVCKDAHSPILLRIVVEKNFEEVGVLVLRHIVRVRDSKSPVRKVVR